MAFLGDLVGSALVTYDSVDHPHFLSLFPCFLNKHTLGLSLLLCVMLLLGPLTDFSSSLLSPSIEVPQGTILGPLLPSLYASSGESFASHSQGLRDNPKPSQACTSSPSVSWAPSPGTQMPLHRSTWWPSSTSYTPVSVTACQALLSVFEVYSLHLQQPILQMRKLMYSKHMQTEFIIPVPSAWVSLAHPVLLRVSPSTQILM